MVYSSSKKTRHISSIVNQPSGGGSKKAGFPYQIGRNSWSSIYINTCHPENRRELNCCTLNQMMTNRFKMPVGQSRPIGRNNNGPYWRSI